MRANLLLVFLLVFQSHVFSQDLTDFQSRFKFVRDNEGSLIEVRDRSLTMNIGIKDFLKGIKTLAQDFQSSSQRSGVDYQVQMATDLILENIENSNSSASRSSEMNDVPLLRPHIEKSLKNIVEMDINSLFKDPKVEKFIQNFEKDLQKAWSLWGLNLIARPQDSQFFYKRNVTYEVVKIALNLAKNQFSQIPVLNLVSYVVVEYEKLVTSRRTYHQNMFLHYLENYDHSELGLTKKEADHIFSSIYESRLSLVDFMLSQNLKNSWESYGTDQFYNRIRQANRYLILRPEAFDELGERINFAFQVAVINDEKVILNLFDKAHMFSGKAAISYYFDQPHKVQLTRALTRLAQVGMGFISMPGWVKSFANQILDSSYKEHSLTEGALNAYFLSQNENNLAKSIQKQSLNPFLQ